MYIDKPFLGRCQITLIINGSKLELVVVWSISWIKEKPTHEKAHTPKVSTRQTQRFILKLVANVPTAVFWCLFIRVWKQSNGCIFFYITVLDVYLWESQIQNMKYETNLATCIISKIPNLRNEFDYDCNKSKHRNVTVIWFFFSLILCCLLKHILEAYRFRSFIHTNLQHTYV